MEKKKIRKEYIFLAVIIIVLSLILILRNPNKIQYELPELKPIDQADISKIEIIKPSETLTLQQKNGVWTLGPEEYPADEYRSNAIIDAVKDLTLTALISETENYSLYGLDKDNRISVRVYSENELIREFEMGKDASTYRHTYVKIKDDKRVYHARNSFKNDFDQELNDLRDKSVLSFDKSEITAVELLWKDNSIKFKKEIRPVEKEDKSEEEETPNEPQEKEPEKPETEEFWVTEDGKEAIKTELENIIDQCSDLKCQEFIYGKTKDDFKDPILTITFTGAAKDYILTVFENSEEHNDHHPAISSENKYLFLLTKNKIDNLNQKPEKLLGQEEKKD
ncbi:MAG: DUF4340 domain-containing protein [Candidatus Aminicenantes bacterium]|nr:DUF4340 domain-containing protein [Candidatus Aminicenantes bacterium]